MFNTPPSVAANLYPVRPPVNTLHSVIQDFLEGAPFTQTLCDRVSATYCASASSPSYKKKLEYVKSVFAQSKHTRVGQTHYVVNSPVSFDELETALLIRFLNLSYHARLIIVFNGMIVFTPQFLRHHPEESIRIYTHQCLQENTSLKVSSWYQQQRRRLARWLNPSQFKDHALFFAV